MKEKYRCKRGGDFSRSRFTRTICTVLVLILCACVTPTNVSAASTKDTAHFQELYNAVSTGTASIDVSKWNYSYKEVYSTLDYTLSACPELYFCDYGNCQCYSYGGKAVTLKLAYNNRAASQPEIDAAVSKLVASIDSTFMSDWEIALAVHDYIISHTRYAYDWYLADKLSEHPYVYDLDGVLGKSLGVCSGYSKAYMYILKTFYGIDCLVVSSEQRFHSWNLIKIDGAWYHVDLTHDDPVWDNLGRVNHEFFLLTDEEMLRLDPVRSDYKIISSPTTSYSKGSSPSLSGISFWTNTETSCCYYNGRWYYINSATKTLNWYSPNENLIGAVTSLPNNTWRVLDSYGWLWPGTYSRMFISDNILYYSTASDIRSYNISTGDSKIIKSIDTSDGLIYGFGLVGENVGLVVRPDPITEGFESITTLSEHFFHSWDNGVLEESASYSADGIVRYSCISCNEEKIGGFGIKRPLDVPCESWYDKPVEWALGHAIASGTGDGKFSPEISCTRAQLVTLLWRYYGCPEPMESSNPFTDVSAKAYYYDAVLWAQENGIVYGTSQNLFSPDSKCTRAQAVTILHRALSSRLPDSDNAPYIEFDDVDYDSWYGRAVVWAVKLGIVSGVGNCKFEPNGTCTRAQIVTMLYRTSTFFNS